MFNRSYDFAMIGHTQLFLWPRYSVIISLLTITVRGYQISIADCLFSSPESKAHGELIVYQSSHRLCVSQSVCPHFKTFTSLRPVDRLQPNFIRSIIGDGERLH